MPIPMFSGHPKVPNFTTLFSTAKKTMEVSIGAVPIPANEEVEFELLPFLRVYRSGRVERYFGNEKVPPSLDPATGVASKDVIIDPSTGIFARLYLPPEAAVAACGAKIPILIYIHGGGFCVESAATPYYHSHINDLSRLTPLLAVSVDYRLAPEHHLPAAYEDSWTALRWVFSRADPWLAQYGDYGRVFVAGDSAGGNITHHVVLRAAADEGMNIEGMVLIHPYFGGSKQVGSEPPDSDRGWFFVFPESEGCDDPRRNPVAEGAPSLADLKCKRVLVTVAEKDILKERGKIYYEKLKESGWGGEAELYETPEEDHDFHILDPETEQAKNKVKHLVDFFRKY